MKAILYNLDLHENRIMDLLHTLNTDDIKIYCDFSQGLYTEYHKTHHDDYRNSVNSVNVIFKFLDKKYSDKLIYLNNDANIDENYQMVKDTFDYDYDFEYKYYPFIFLSEKQFNFYDKKINESEDKKYRIISMNNQSRIMRDMVLAELHNYENFCYSKTNDYSDHSHITRINRKDIYFIGNYLNLAKTINDPYHSLYFLIDEKNNYDGSKIKSLTNVNLTDNDNNYFYDNCAANEYFESHLDLIVDCHMAHSICFSEKIFRPLYCQKPFLILSTKHYYKKLTDMGFLLYDEIFDYSFDTQNLKKRYQSVVEQSKNILKMEEKKFLKILDSIQPKLKFNKNLYLKYYKNNAFDNELLINKKSFVNYHDVMKKINLNKEIEK
jgi:hypothetical protein